MFLLVTTIIKFTLLILLFVLPLAAVLTWMERRQSAYLQDRVGPTRASIRLFGRDLRLAGLVHVVADGVKSFFKENFIPSGADRTLFKIAPLIGFTTSLVVMALVPFGPDLATADVPLIGGWLARTFPEHSTIPLQIARVDAGILYVFAVSSLGIYGVALAGWASNNRFAMMGGLRAAAQGISYEIALGLTVVGVLIAFGHTELSRVVAGQGRHLFGGLPAWGLFVQPFAAMLFLTAAIAETKRTPFDLPEGESEIIGYFLEYSSMGFGLFMLGEFVEIVVLSSVFVTLFLGGWQLPWVLGERSLHLGFATFELSSFGVAVAGMFVFGAKVFLMSAFQLQLRWTLPRFRYDQLMRLGWKSLLPLALVNIFVTAGLVWLDPTLEVLGVAGFGLIAAFAVVVLAGPRRKSTSHVAAEPNAAAGHVATGKPGVVHADTATALHVAAPGGSAHAPAPSSSAGRRAAANR